MFTHGHSVTVGPRGRMRIAVLIALYIYSLTALITPAHCEQYDLIAAHGALDWDTNGDGVADGWSLARDGSIVGGAKLVKSNSGLAEQMYTNSVAGRAGELRLFYEIPVGTSAPADVGDTIHAAAMVRSSVRPGQYVAADIGCLDSQRNPVAAHYLLPQTTARDSRWRSVSAGFAVPPGTAWISLSFRLGVRNGWGIGSFLVDDVRLTKEVAYVSEPPAGAIPAFVERNPGSDAIYAAKRYGAFIAYPQTHACIRTWKVHHPSARVILFQLHGAAIDPDNGVPSDPVGYAWIDRYHPEWFLKDADGQRITDSADPTKFAVDIGNPDYQRAWAQSAVANAKRAGADGVLIGNVRTSLAWAGDRRPVNYPDDQSWLAAEDAFIRHVAAVLRQAALLAIGGGGNSSWSEPPWSGWMAVLDGAHYEAPCDDVACQVEPYENWKKLLDGCRLFPNKVYLHGASHPVNDDVAMYDLAGFLLGAGPNSYFGYRGTEGPTPRYHPILDISIGAPLGEPEEVGYRTYHRSFADGEVYVNADAASDATVQVPQGLQDVSGNPVSSGPRDLGPRQGLVLLRAGGSVPGGGGGGPGGQTVAMDLLGGLGDFEYAGDVSWNVYGHPDYDFDGNSGWVGDYRSTILLKSDVVRRNAGSGAGDTVTIELRHSPDLLALTRTYEFTDGSGARPGYIEVNIGADGSPANAVAKLREAIDREQGSGGSGAVSVSVSGSVVYVKPSLHWELKAFSDSDASDSRMVSVFRSWRSGYDIADADDSVAVGWQRKSGSTLDPAANTVWRIARGSGLSASSMQYFAIRNYHGSEGTAYLCSSFSVKDQPSRVHVGDYVVFRVDLVRMSGHESLPTGAFVAYRIGLNMGGTRHEQIIAPSATGTSAEIARTVPAGVSEVEAYLRVDVRGDIGQREVGAYVDGAHLNLRRAAGTELATWQVPANRDRAVKSMLVLFNPRTKHDIYWVARNFDTVVTGEYSASWLPLLRYLNPQIKAYLYESSTVSGVRDIRGVDAWYTDSPLGMGFVAANYPEWLYENGSGHYVSLPSYPTQYFARISSSGFQNTWAARARDKALKWRFDGVWIDDLVERAEERQDGILVLPGMEPWEVQQFLHGVVPIFRLANLDVIVNSATKQPDAGTGQIYENPFWVPSAPYDGPNYLPNSPATVPNGFQNEWSFWTLRGKGNNYTENVYDEVYWLQCLSNMDTIERWDTDTGANALGPGEKRWMHMLAVGLDNAYDPAYGADGWLRFGLCSYLLAQNDWTSFAYGLRSNYTADMELSVTKRLGAPSGDHSAYNGDPYLRFRKYRPTSTGGVGGVVVVNGYHDQTKTYRVDFNAVDEAGTPITAGTTITLKPHTGRILLRSQ